MAQTGMLLWTTVHVDTLAKTLGQSPYHLTIVGNLRFNKRETTVICSKCVDIFNFTIFTSVFFIFIADDKFKQSYKANKTLPTAKQQFTDGKHSNSKIIQQNTFYI